MIVFANSHAKLGRAKRHIAELRDCLKPYFAKGAVNISNTTIKGGEFSCIANYEALPADVPLILGDIFHNLRTSLDLMASELARTTSGDHKGVYFPFAYQESALDEQIKLKKFHKCGQAAVDQLKALRPYKGGNEDLRAIHDMDIMDKHVALLPDVKPSHTLFSFTLALDEQGQVVPTILPPAEDELDVVLVFPEGSALAGREMFQTLEDLVNLCEGILKRFIALDKAK
jgi:hypothetical protein